MINTAGPALKKFGNFFDIGSGDLSPTGRTVFCSAKPTPSFNDATSQRSNRQHFQLFIGAQN
ncbi:MAG: hypothetical protein EOO90_32110 [Pedobacter sp.]|nr:MAG: hypothetical protein EOO90_32110 [Pedobacter sp.]